MLALLAAGTGGNEETIPTILIALAFVLLGAKLAGELVERLGQPAVLEDAHFKGHVDRGEMPLHESLAPLIALFVPVFIRPDGHAGGPPDLRGHLDPHLRGPAHRRPRCWGSWSDLVVPKGVSPLTVGIGMMPRGEVGLIFAAMGAKLILDGRPVIDAGTYAAAILMVVATTMATPPLLAWALRRNG